MPVSVDIHAELERAVSAARAAGAVLREIARHDLVVLNDEGRDVKLQADRDAEAVILEMLRESGYPMLAEESGEHNLENAELFWVIDPLDGTMNYLRQLPFCAVSIALATCDHARLGVVYDFNRDEMFTGISGEGAWLNGQPIRVSTVHDVRQAILTTGFPAKRIMAEDNIQAFVDEARRFKKVRLLGSAALMLAYVACGRVDGYAEDEIMWWDVAGGLALIDGAGGYFQVQQSQNFKWGRTVRCANSPILWVS